MKEEWLMPGAVVPVDIKTTAALVAEIKRLIEEDEMTQVSIESDMSKAIQDAMMCGTGVMKFSFMDGLISCDHVPIKEFAQLSEELKWRAENEDAK
jgi:hypothetical protein